MNPYSPPYEAAPYGDKWGVRFTGSDAFLLAGMDEGSAKARARDLIRARYEAEAIDDAARDYEDRQTGGFW